MSETQSLSAETFKEVLKSRDFTGKVVLVTGSSGGIGEAIVKLFAYLGAQIVVTGRNVESIKRVAAEARELSPKKLKPLEVVADLQKSVDLKRLLIETIDTYGRLDVLVNNAGVGSVSSVRDDNFMNAFDTTINTNLRAVLELSHLAVPYLEKTNGTIINNSSIVSLYPHALGLAYCVAKTGLDMATKILALELGPKIRVNSVNPGTTLTDSFRSLASKSQVFKDMIIRSETNAPLGRVGSTFDIAKAVTFLASTDAQYITGAILVVDGGLVHNNAGPFP
ncbi:unnamed protein product [Medioppia subpectinata]|uniref:Uncharacterized protein n=1 Tax=Medioppia subpectinata TaxID=1979941 RepID=A0A7R9PZW9_9ACAR|nr:unnamed protein product [Medioppia subpectinata]CAG2106914.1 unnamed protein product [Medioppia subpectinata]